MRSPQVSRKVWSRRAQHNLNKMYAEVLQLSAHMTTDRRDKPELILKRIIFRCSCLGRLPHSFGSLWFLLNAEEFLCKYTQTPAWHQEQHHHDACKLFVETLHFYRQRMYITRRPYTPHTPMSASPVIATPAWDVYVVYTYMSEVAATTLGWLLICKLHIIFTCVAVKKYKLRKAFTKFQWFSVHSSFN